jgi:segregation and condensation protein A
MIDAETYHVRLEVFEGPLDLLLTLIQRESLDCTTVALRQVTDQYLAYLSQLEEIDPGAIAEFCRVAAKLIVIKSRALLPAMPGVLDDEDGDAHELAERLREYRRLRSAAAGLSHRQERGLRAYVRVARQPDVTPKLDPGDVSVDDLTSALQSVLAQASEREASTEVRGVRPHPVRLSERLQDIQRLLGTRRSVGFAEVLTGERTDREFIIVSFLAVLELLRRRTIRCVQTELFGDITLELAPEPNRLSAGADSPTGSDGA